MSLESLLTDSPLGTHNSIFPGRRELPCLSAGYLVKDTNSGVDGSVAVERRTGGQSRTQKADALILARQRQRIDDTRRVGDLDGMLQLVADERDLHVADARRATRTCT